MSDFCISCEPLFNDLVGLCEVDRWCQVICEGCGRTVVDSTGACVVECEYPENHMRCPRCNTQLVRGQAIKPNRDPNTRYVSGILPVITADTMELIDVVKCPSCGNSEGELDD